MLVMDIHFHRGEFALDVTSRLEAPTSGLFGPSGAGKSTLLSILAGLLRPDTGWIELNGRVLLDTEHGVDVPPHQRRLGFVFQHGYLFPHMTVHQNLLYGWRTPFRFSFEEIIRLLEIESLLERQPRELSGGERQRVALGRALLCSPELLLLDEPMSSLDRRLKQQIAPFLARALKTTGIPALYVSHDLNEILCQTDRFLMLDRGRVAADGRFRELVQHPEALALMRDQGLLNVLPLIIDRHAADAGVTFLHIPDSPLEIRGPYTATPPKGILHAGLRPEDIALSLRKLEGTSIQNQLPGRITHTVNLGDREACVIDVGMPLIVEITHSALQQLGLSAGKDVWCLFKTRAIQYLDRAW